jgi:hypothetical protein
MAKTKKCPGCGALFTCRDDQVEACWCASLPDLPFPQQREPVCLCESCLMQAIIAQIDGYVAAMHPGKARSENPAAKLPKRKAYEGIDYYIENGKYVFTAWFHLKRGHCCESGCRHCPY